jgi:hypothetical protein
MTTSIQELIKELKYVQEFPMISGIIKRAELLLEKEKEQIMNAFISGKINGYEHFHQGLKSNISAEEYYNQTYNENK